MSFRGYMARRTAGKLGAHTLGGIGGAALGSFGGDIGQAIGFFLGWRGIGPQIERAGTWAIAKTRVGELSRHASIPQRVRSMLRRLERLAPNSDQFKAGLYILLKDRAFKEWWDLHGHELTEKAEAST